jgi:hypothetical protein
MSDKRISVRIRSGAAWMAAAAMLAGLAVHPQAVFGRTRTKGATVSIVTATGMIQGELIGVREDAIVVMGRQEAATVPILEIESVKILKHAPVFGLGILGCLAGGGVGALAAPRIKNDDSLPEGIGKMFTGFVYFGTGALIGIGAGIATALAIGKDKVIVFKGKTKEEIASALDGLKKQARVPDYK